MQYIKKDITTVTSGAIIQGVNCQGVMGSGVARKIRKKWPDVYSQYRHTYKLIKHKHLLLGTAHATEVERNLFVFSCFTQEYYGRDRDKKYASVTAIRKCLTNAFNTVRLLGVTTVYLPKIGCGLGGLDWNKDIEPIISELENSKKNKINIFICVSNKGEVQMDLNDQKTYYAIRSRGLVGGKFTTMQSAEKGKLMLPVEVQAEAVIVKVDSNGRELLFG